MLHDLFAWLRAYGASSTPDGRSYSEMLEGSWNFWNVLEGTHLLTLMIFFGTIIMVDLRLLGLTFRKTPVSVVSERLLMLTVFSMVVMLATGVLLFLAKPVIYYHSIWFRAKMVLLVLAFINIWVFHKMVQKNQAEWDNAESPPLKAKISGALSLTFWILIIACGRFIAYNWFDCGKPLPSWINAAAECAASEHGAIDIGSPEAKALDDALNAEAAPSVGLPALSEPAPSPGLPELPAADAAAKTEGN